MRNWRSQFLANESCWLNFLAWRICRGGYLIVPHVFEFWQGHVNRMHDRIVFRHPKSGEAPDGKLLHQGDNGWVMERLGETQSLCNYYAPTPLMLNNFLSAPWLIGVIVNNNYRSVARWLLDKFSIHITDNTMNCLVACALHSQRNLTKTWWPEWIWIWTVFAKYERC